MVLGVDFVYRLFNGTNAMLRSYAIEWHTIRELEESRFAIDTGLSGKPLELYTHGKMAAFYNVTLPDCLQETSSGSAIGDPAAGTVIGDPSTGIVFTA